MFHKGLFSGDYLVEWLGGILEDIGITTFAQLRDDDKDSGLPLDRQYRLIVHTADITRGKVVRLPWDYGNYGMEADSQRIVDAVRASMSIPFFFDPVQVDVDESVTYDGVTYDPGKVTWVDGGLLSNFPVEVFDRSDGQPARWDTIGIKLSANEVTMPPTRSSRDTWDEAMSCLHTVLNNANRYYLPPDKAARTIFVDSGGIASTDFHITPEQRGTLFDHGQAAAKKWLAHSGAPTPQSA
jgi:NTE family protein